MRRSRTALAECGRNARAERKKTWVSRNSESRTSGLGAENCGHKNQRTGKNGAHGMRIVEQIHWGTVREFSPVVPHFALFPAYGAFALATNAGSGACPGANGTKAASCRSRFRRFHYFWLRRGDPDRKSLRVCGERYVGP